MEVNLILGNLFSLAAVVCLGVSVVKRSKEKLISWFPIVVSSSYTVFMYISRNDQQMRYALISNLLLWLVHDIYVEA